MWIFLFLVGLLCLLLVIGAYTQMGALKFAAKSSVVLGATAFVAFLCVVAYFFIEPMFERVDVSLEPAYVPSAPGQPTDNKTYTLEQLMGNEVNSKPIETESQRRRRLGLPVPFETVLSRSFPKTDSQALTLEDGSDGGTIGWEMNVAEIPNYTPSTRKTGFFMGLEDVVVTLDGEKKLVCQNTAPKYQKRLLGCRPLVQGKDGVLHQSFEGDWDGETYPIGTEVEFYVILPCTKDLIEAEEPCQL